MLMEIFETKKEEVTGD